MNNRKFRLLMAVMLVLVAGACSTKRVDESHVGVRYNDGFLEGRSFERVVEPGGNEMVVNDDVYMLPIRQITWQTGDCEGCDAASLTITTKDRVQLVVDLAIRGTLNTDDETLEEFFNSICKKTRSTGGENSEDVTGCWEGADDKGQLGWDLMLKETFGNPMIAVANDAGATFDSKQLRYDPEVKDAFAAAFAEEFSSAQARLIGNGDYFCQPGYKRNKDDCKELTVEVTRVVYADGILETIETQRQASVEATELAVQQEAQAIAEQRVAQAKATAENLELMEREAMLKCAENPECTLVFVPSGNSNIAIPAG